MFITARIVGILAYVMAGGLMYLFVRKVRPGQTKALLALYTVLLCVIAYCYVPDENSDLFRIDLYAKDFSRYSIRELIRTCVEYSSPLALTPAAVFYYAFLGNGSAIACISCAIMFALIFFVLYDFGRQTHLSRGALALAVVCFMCLDVYMPMIATVRSYISCVLIAFCFYREFTRCRFPAWHIILYIIAATMHLMGVLLVLFRIVFFVFFEQDSLKLKVLAAVAASIVLIVLLPLYERFLTSSINTLLGYLNNSTAYSYIWEQTISAIHLVLCFVVYRWYKKSGTGTYIITEKYKKLLGVTLLLYLISFIQFSMMQRFCFFCALVYLPALCSFFERCRNKYTRRFYILISLVLLVLTCSRGYLCSIKFW